MPTLFESLQCGSGRCIALTGSGGKTAIMLQLGREMQRLGKRVIISTTTKIAAPAGRAGEDWFLIGEGLQIFRERWKKSCIGPALHTVGSRLAEDGKKLDAISIEAVKELLAWDNLDHLLVEADGSRGKALKGHAPYEPVIPDECDIVISVTGMGIIGAPLTEEYVHRHEIVMRLLQKDEGAVLGWPDVAALLLHPEGYLGRVGSRETRIILNGISEEPQRLAALSIAESLAESGYRHMVCLRGPLFGLSPDNEYGHKVL